MNARKRSLLWEGDVAGRLLGKFIGSAGGPLPLFLVVIQGAPPGCWVNHKMMTLLFEAGGTFVFNILPQMRPHSQGPCSDRAFLAGRAKASPRASLPVCLLCHLLWGPCGLLFGLASQWSAIAAVCLDGGTCTKAHSQCSGILHLPGDPAPISSRNLRKSSIADPPCESSFVWLH